jgi:hypothetical protein
VPTYGSGAEPDEAVAPAYLEEWVRFPGESWRRAWTVTPSLRGRVRSFHSGHSAGHQAVVVENDDGPLCWAAT